MTDVSRKSLSLRAVMYVALIFLALLALEGWREWTARSVTLEKAQLETTNLAHSLRQHAEDTFEIASGAISSVVGQVQQIGLRAGTEADILNHLTRIVARVERLQGVFVYGPDGTLAVASDAAVAPAPQAPLELFAQHRASSSPAPLIGTPIPVPGGGYMIPVSQRIETLAGQFGGVVVATVDVNYFSDFYEGFEVGEAGAIGLITKSGTLLALSPFDPEAFKAAAGYSELLLKRIENAPTGGYSYWAPVGQASRVGGYDVGSKFPIVSLVTITTDQALAPWSSSLQKRLPVTIALALGLALLGLRLTDQISSRHRVESELAARDAEFRLLADSAGDLVERFGPEGHRQYVSPASTQLTGYAPDELVGKLPFDNINAEDRAAVRLAGLRLTTGARERETVSFRYQHKDGHEIWLETSLSRSNNGVGVVGVTRDITSRKLLEQQLENMAMIDGLTGIANRRTFDTAISREVARAGRTGSPLSLLIIDADRFKRFNDDYGHIAGDSSLKAIAHAIAGAARRPTDVAARYGGEEFVVLLPDSDLGAARKIAADLCRQVQALSIPHERNLPWRVATVSIGIATMAPDAEGHVESADWLIATADLALYVAKSQGRNQYAVSTPQLPDRLVG